MMCNCVQVSRGILNLGSVGSLSPNDHADSVTPGRGAAAAAGRLMDSELINRSAA